MGEIWAKDERNRWGQGSFKSLGGAYAVVSLAAEALSVPPAAIFAGSAPKAADMTVVTATAGNHGRAVAFGAKLTGAGGGGAAIALAPDPEPVMAAIRARGYDARFAYVGGATAEDSR